MNIKLLVKLESLDLRSAVCCSRLSPGKLGVGSGGETVRGREQDTYTGMALTRVFWSDPPLNKVKYVEGNSALFSISSPQMHVQPLLFVFQRY